MLTTIPASGYALCYGPLALVIVGFVLFAILGDADARRRYLRRTSLSAEGDAPAYVPVARSAELTTETPSGLVVQIQPDVVEDPAPPIAPVTRAEPEPAGASDSAEEPQPAIVAEAPEEPDDLKRIEGIGPKMESVLNAAGITTFAQLAAVPPDRLRQRLDEAGVRRINDPGTWPEQAALAARGEWDALNALQDSLKGGRSKA